MVRRKPKRRQRELNSPVLAKITGPVLTGVYPRTRLFRLLDDARKRSIVWITAPAGAGKTTLIASYVQTRRLPTLWYQIDSGDNDAASFFYYMSLGAKAATPRQRKELPLLTREYLAGLSTFTANYFRDLFARLRRPSAIVFDNFQEVDSDGTFHETLHIGLRQVPPGVTVVIVSRLDPPATFARLRARGQIAVLGWDDLKLTAEESTGVIKLRRHQSLSRQMIQRLHEHTQGWAAGLVLLTEQTDKNTVVQSPPDRSASQSVFDYFASEVFRSTSPAARQFLLKTAFLPKVSVFVAQQLTEERNCEEILRDLTQRNYFTFKHVDGSYEYHPMFRAFLETKASAAYTAEQIKGLKRRSAQLLAETGNAEVAVSLLLQAEDWHGAVQLILAHAAALFAQGRIRTLERWLKGVPEALRVEQPYLLYWAGVCRLPFAPAEARGYFELAFALFEKQADASPLYLTWSRIIESFLFELNDLNPMGKWLDIYPSLKNDRIAPKGTIENAAVFTYVAGLTNARTDHPDLAIYVERAEQLLRADPNPDRQLARAAILVPYYLWKGEEVKAGVLIDQLAPFAAAPSSRPFARLNWYMWKSLYASGLGVAHESMQAVTEGLKLADASGIHLFDLQLVGFGVWAEISAQNVPAARALLQRISSMGQLGLAEEAIYRHHASMVAVHEGDMVRAVEEGRRAVDLAKAGGLLLSIVANLVGLAYIYFRQGDAIAALSAVEEARVKAIAMQSKYFTMSCCYCEAFARRLQGERDKAIEALRTGVTLASEIGVARQVWCLNEDAASLYALALEAGICVDFVRRTIARLGLSPPADFSSELWPWPVRIYTLGRFDVVKNETPLTLGGRVQKKPLELLRVLVAFGGRDVPIGKITQALWPDADGDTAKIALETTLHRLRRLLGEKCITMQHRLVSLDPTYCWVDVWSFERILDASAVQPPTTVAATHLFDLYSGPFLGEETLPEATLVRARLRAKFLRLILREGKSFESSADEQGALTWYQKGIEVDPLAEELYLRLMHCYRRLNRPVEALSVYQRCQTALGAMLQIEPTPEMKALYAEIRRGLTQ